MTNYQKLKFMNKDEVAHFLADEGFSINGNSGYEAIAEWFGIGRKTGPSKKPQPYPEVKRMLIEKYGSIRRASLALNINIGVLCDILNGRKSFYPKYRSIVAEALEMDEAVLFPKAEEK